MISHDLAVCALLAVTMAATAEAAVILVPATHDNTLYEDAAGSVSNGAGAAMFAGANAQSRKRRAVLVFDLADALPPESTVVGVTLRLYNSAANTDPRPVAVHRLLESWGEGASNGGATGGGSGVAAESGDATWIHRFYPDTPWSRVGGLYSDAPAAVTTIGGVGFYEWSSPGLAADVASFLAEPSTNFGWVLIGDESVASSVRRFSTREDVLADYRPQLMIDVIPAPGTGAVAIVALAVGMHRRRHPYSSV